MARGDEGSWDASGPGKGGGKGRGRGADRPSRIPAQGWRDVLIRTWRESGNDNVGLIAAGVAFYGFLALVPLLGALILTYGLVADPATVIDHSQRLFELLPPDAARLIGDQMLKLVVESGSKTGLGLAVALALSLYGAMRGAGAIVTALNVAYEEGESRGFIKGTLMSLAITVGAVLVCLVGVAAIGALAFLEALVPDLGGLLILLVRVLFWLVAGLAASAAVAALYRYGPNRDHAKWRWLSPGAVLATLGWLAVSLGFGFYTANFANYDATYGALGAVVVLLMWLYLSAYVLIFGAEFNSEIEHQTARDSTVGRPQPMGQRDASVADTLGDTPEGPFGKG